MNHAGAGDAEDAQGELREQRARRLPCRSGEALPQRTVPGDGMRALGWLDPGPQMTGHVGHVTPSMLSCPKIRIWKLDMEEGASAFAFEAPLCTWRAILVKQGTSCKKPPESHSRITWDLHDWFVVCFGLSKVCFCLLFF